MILAESLSIGAWCFLVLAVGLALSFEFVNGFHDTANAVATVIYTHTLKPWVAVIWSGMFNLIGVLLSSGLIAFTIVSLLPVELVVKVGSSQGFAMVFALLISSILWNLGTWYLGLPASSTHTLVGSILGVGLANSLMKPGHVFGEGVNWAEAGKVFTSLLLSPLIGFCFSALLLLVCKLLIKAPELYKAPPKDAPPPTWIRALLIFTCTGVSFSHGSNDGQKGMGLMLLILIGILPATYALDIDGMSSDKLASLEKTAQTVQVEFASRSNGATVDRVKASDELSDYLKPEGKLTDQTWAALSTMNQTVAQTLGTKQSLKEVSPEERKSLRTDIYLESATIRKMDKADLFGKEKDPAKNPLKKSMADFTGSLDKATNFVPLWVKIAVALALGLGTMIGWKRIVVTVGEKIGKDHLTYAQGASAELVAMTTIQVADMLHLPVSTTHVLSSGVAGTMAANRSGLQMATLRNLLLAWVLTLPVCVLLGAATFAGGLYVVLNNLVPVTIVVVGGLIAVVGTWQIRKYMARAAVESPAAVGN